MFVFFSISFLSCKKNIENFENNRTNTRNEINKNVSIKTIDGILVFSNEETFSKTLQEVTQMSENERKNWENHHNIVSLRTAYEKILNAEHEALIKPFEGKTDAELALMPKPNHSKEYEQGINDGIIKEILEADGTQSFELKSKAGFMAYLTNKEGFVLAGKKLYLIQDKYIKTKNNATLNDRSLLLNSFVGNQNDIEIIDVLKKDRNTIDFNKVEPWGVAGNCRFGQEVWMRLDYTSTTNCKVVHTTLHTMSQKKNFWGNWVADPKNHYRYWCAWSSIGLNNTSNNTNIFYFYGNIAAFISGGGPPSSNPIGVLYFVSNTSDAWTVLNSNTNFSSIDAGPTYIFNQSQSIKYRLNTSFPYSTNGYGMSSPLNWF